MFEQAICRGEWAFVTWGHGFESHHIYYVIPGQSENSDLSSLRGQHGYQHSSRPRRRRT